MPWCCVPLYVGGRNIKRMLKKQLFLTTLLATLLAIAAVSHPAMAQDWQSVFESPVRVLFILVVGFFISVSVWAILERQNIARRFHTILQAKAIEDELLDFAPAGYLILRQGGFCYASDRLREWLGFTSPISHIDELLGKDDQPGFDPESFEKLKNYILQIARRRIPLPLRLNHTQQEEDLYIFGKSIRDAEDKENCILIWVTLGEGASLKARGRAVSGKGADLMQSPESFDLYLEAQSETLNGLSTSVAIFGPDQTLRFCNQAFQGLWTLPENWEEMVPNHSEFLEKMREERRLPEQADFASWKKHILSYYTVLRDPVEEMWHLPDGRTLRVITQPYLLGGLIVFFEDVTDKLDMERSYNTLIAVQRETLDHLHEAVAVIGSDGRIRLYNPNFAKTWELGEQELRNQPHISEVLEFCKPLLASDEAKWNELKNQILGYIINRDQTTGRWVLTNGNILRYNIVPLPDGASLLTVSDISDSVKIENALRDKNKALETADKLKSEFVTSISEDLQMPLNSIISFSEILDKEYFGPLNDKQKNYLSWIMNSSQQVKNFIDDVMDLAVLEAGQVTLQTKEFEVAKTIRRVVDIVREKSHTKHFSINLKSNASTGKITGDEHRLQHALMNILEDAIERIPAGEKILITAKGSKTQVEISIGYKNAEIPLFLREQLPLEAKKKSTLKSEKDVIGLRLSLARSILKLHGGEVIYDLKPDKNSTIKCIISRSFIKKTNQLGGAGGRA